MLDMQAEANKYWKLHRGEGNYSKVTPYSFTWNTFPDKNGKSTTTVFYASYFLNLGGK